MRFTGFSGSEGDPSRGKAPKLTPTSRTLYYLFVDSPVATGSASAGSYQVLLSKLCPAELIDFSIE
jgi:hypothetical protein